MSDSTLNLPKPKVYMGHYGEFTITDGDRLGVWIYRGGLAVAAICFAIATGLTFWHGDQAGVQQFLTVLYFGFCLAMGVSLYTIHIYLVPLHRLLQAFWAIGFISAIAIELLYPESLALTVYQHPQTIWGIGFTFAALTGIYFKEGFCFNRLETKLLTPLIPVLLLGHLSQLMPMFTEQLILGFCSILFLIFAARKFTQVPADDIGDKSVFEMLKNQKK